MELLLANVDFTNDIFSVAIPGDNILILNKIDESLKIESEEREVDIKRVNIEVYTREGKAISCPCVIGMSNVYIKINTAYKEYEGDVLTSDNMKYCTITVYE